MARVNSESSVPVHSNGAVRSRPQTKSNNLKQEPQGEVAVSANGSKQLKTERTSKRRKARSLVQRWVRFSLRHSWVNPLIVILIVLFTYALNPTPSNPFHSAIFLSYPLTSADHGSLTTPIQYGKGRGDLAFVAFYTIVFSFTRDFLMQQLIRPYANYLGIRSRGKQARFMEQFYTAVYFGVFGPYGMYVMSRTPVWYFDTFGMFDGFPHKTHDALFKAYYLLQASYWAQQGLVLLLALEKPRKDYKELVLHHIITLCLIGFSYRFHFTYVGIAVYITHDISDFFLATSKVLNYVDSPITAPYFVFFIFVWSYMRHYINLRILWAVFTTFKTVGPYELNWETEQYKCWISQWIALVLLSTLQATNLFWYFLIWKIAYRFVVTSTVADERSEDEEDDEEDEEEPRLEKVEPSSVQVDGTKGRAVKKEL